MLIDAPRFWEQVRLGEDSGLELKEAQFRGPRISAPHRAHLADELAAFANSRRGRLVLGVSDDTEAQPSDRTRFDALAKYLTDAFGRADFDLYARLPMIVCCAAPGFVAGVTRDH